MYPVSLEDRIAVSSLVIEGRVLVQHCVWDAGKRNIYTINRIAVAKVFMGESTDSEILVLTRGGIVGLEKEVVSPSLQLQVGDHGLLTLKDAKVRIPGVQSTYLSQGGPQGFIQFNNIERRPVGVFESFKSAESDLYPRCESATGRPHTVVQQLKTLSQDDPTLSKNITSVTPANQTAGTKSTITITGTNFGSIQGLVGFPNADAGGSQYFAALNSEVLSWSDTEVVVEVPDRAGTGQVIIQNSDTEQFISAAPLQIDYAQSLINYPQVNPITYRTRLVNENSATGYTWQMNNDFAANNEAVESFERAMNTWVNTSCINWTIGSNTAVDTVSNDDVNVILFDEAAALFGAVGRCTSRYSACSSVDPEWFIEELDIVFDQSTNWHFGMEPCPPGKTDFQSVATHELGHGHQLNHVIAQGDVMHFQILLGSTNRIPSSGEEDAAIDVMGRSVGSQICSQPSASVGSDCSCPEDVNGDGQVTITDFIEFNSVYGTSCTGCPADINGDGEVNIADFIILNSAYGSICP